MKATAFAPATVANVAVGFDILGFALEGIGETAIVEKVLGSTSVTIDPVEGYPQISTVATKNTATAGLVQLIKDKNLKFGFRVSLQKKIPVGSGLGGSSTSAVAALVAANALLPKKLTRQELLYYALIGEEVASGSRHGDNVAPCLQGGLLFVRGGKTWRTAKIKTPATLRCVVLLPAISINTKEARALLKPEIPLKAMIEQNSNLAGFILGCMSGDFELIGESMRDVVIEPQRAGKIPGFYAFQKAALASGALGCSISGSGPAIFAWAKSPALAKKIQRQWLQVAENEKISVVNSWISPIRKKGAHVIRVRK